MFDVITTTSFKIKVFQMLMANTFLQNDTSVVRPDSECEVFQMKFHKIIIFKIINNIKVNCKKLV